MSKDRFTGSRADIRETRRQISDGEQDYLNSESRNAKEIDAHFAQAEKNHLASLLAYPEPTYDDLVDWNRQADLSMKETHDLADAQIRQMNPQPEAPDYHGEMIDRTRTYVQRKGASWGEQRKKRITRAEKAAWRAERKALAVEGPIGTEAETWMKKGLRREEFAINKGFTDFIPLNGVSLDRKLIVNGHSNGKLTEPASSPVETMKGFQRYQTPQIRRAHTFAIV